MLNTYSNIKDESLRLKKERYAPSFARKESKVSRHIWRGRGVQHRRWVVDPSDLLWLTFDAGDYRDHSYICFQEIYGHEQIWRHYISDLH